MNFAFNDLCDFLHPFPVPFSPSASSKTLYRTLLIESDDMGGDSLSSVLTHAGFSVERCATPAEAVNLYSDHDLVLIRAADGVSAENLRHLVSWLRHNSVEGEESFAMIVAEPELLAQLDGMPCDTLDERTVDSKLPEHLDELRGYFDNKRKRGDASFWTRLFGRSQASEDHGCMEESPLAAENPEQQAAPQKIVETKTGRHMNSPKGNPVSEPKEPKAAGVNVQPVTPLVPREQVAALKTAPREVRPFSRPLEISSIAPILLREMTEAAALLGQDYRVIEANDAWLHLFAAEKGRLLGSAGVEFKTGFDKVAWANILHRALLGREFDADQEALDPPLQSLKVRPVPGEDGTPMGVLILCTATTAGDLKLSQSVGSMGGIESRAGAEVKPDIERQKVRIKELSSELATLRGKIQRVEAEAGSARDELEKERVAARATQEKFDLQRVRFDDLVDALASARWTGGEANRKQVSLLAEVSSPKLDLSLLDYAPFGLVRLSSDGEVMFANARVDGLLGFPIRCGQSFTDWIAKGRSSDETSAALVDEWTDKVWRRQMICVVQLAGDDGLLKDVEFRPVLMDDGGLLVFATDVTDRQQVYHALRSAEAKFHGMFRSTVAGIALMDGEGAIYDANANFCEMFARKRGEICSITLPALVRGCIGDEASFDESGNPLRLTLPDGRQAVLVCPAPDTGENEARAIFCVPVPVPVVETKQSAASGAGVSEGIRTMRALVDEWRQLMHGRGDKTLPDVLARWLEVLNATISPDRRNEVDIAGVVRDLIAGTRRRMSEEARENVLFDAPVDERFIPCTTAIPLALAISELMQNAVEHGLENGVIEGLVRVHFTSSENEIVTEICNTGAELRSGFEFESHAGEGLKLARLLIMRVGGKLSIDSGTETRCQLNLPLK